ncbi:hypothetical protein [Empedobacter tilapiae]|uniref:hypothetical protein n=1 Tax=Empedobacter tilapiae TaxID=2491114 RepID=UPI0028D74635|nr:hypothetical protein [Empedobacter tilapiae]
MNELNINDRVFQYMSEDSIDWIEDIFYYLKIKENKNSDEVIKTLENEFNTQPKRVNLLGQERTFIDSLEAQSSHLNGYLNNFFITEKLGKVFKRRKVERHEFVSFINDDFDTFLESINNKNINNEELLIMYIKAIKDNRPVYINDNHFIFNRDIEIYYPFLYCDFNKDGSIEIRLCSNVFRRLSLIRNTIDKKIDNFQTNDKSMKRFEDSHIEDEIKTKSIAAPHQIAILHELGILEFLKDKGLNKNQIAESIQYLLNIKSKRRVIGNLNIIDPKIEEDPIQYTAHNYLETAKKNISNIIHK